MQYSEIVRLAERMIRGAPEDFADGRNDHCIASAISAAYEIPIEVTTAAVREAMRRIGECECEGCGG